MVAKGSTQREGVDFNLSFSPSVRLESVWMMMLATLVNRLHTHQMDVTAAFLHATLDEEVDMEMVKGMSESGRGDKLL